MFNIKNLTKKIKNKKLKGNISLLVILILLATSVITLLSINQITRLITYWNQTFNYFRSYYLAKAWTELWLAEVYNREDWFNHEVLSWSDIVSWNLVWNFAGFNPYFDMTISWSFKVLTNDIKESNECSWNNRIKLNSGAGIMLSLFSDKTEWTDKILSEWTDEFNIFPLPTNDIKNLKLTNSSNTDWQLTFAFFTYEKYTDESWISDYIMDDIIVERNKKPDELNPFLGDNAKNLVQSPLRKKYLTIKNSWENPIEFCIKIESYNETLIPYSNSLITSIWHYGDTEVWIQSIVKKWVPDWTLNVIDKTSWS